MLGPAAGVREAAVVPVVEVEEAHPVVLAAAFVEAALELVVAAVAVAEVDRSRNLEVEAHSIVVEGELTCLTDRRMDSVDIHTAGMDVVDDAELAHRSNRLVHSDIRN